VLGTIVRACVALIVMCAALWGAAVAGLYLAMRQPPETFGAVMSRVPGMAMVALPFRPLWMSARRGHLDVGDRAPDFSLPVLHGGSSQLMATDS
jgi:hypothetical protein